MGFLASLDCRAPRPPQSEALRADVHGQLKAMLTFPLPCRSWVVLVPKGSR
jgi:hypothetical protein